MKADPYERTVAAGKAAVDILRRGHRADRLKLTRREAVWLDLIDHALSELPDDWRELMAAVEPQYGGAYDKRSYGLV